MKVSVTDNGRKAYLSISLKCYNPFYFVAPSLNRYDFSFEFFFKYVLYTDRIMDEKYRQQLSGSSDPEKLGNFNKTGALIYLSSITIEFCF